MNSSALGKLQFGPAAAYRPSGSLDDPCFRSFERPFERRDVEVERGRGAVEEPTGVEGGSPPPLAERSGKGVGESAITGV